MEFINHDGHNNCYLNQGELEKKEWGYTSGRLVDTDGTKLGTCNESMSATVGAMVVGMGASARAGAASAAASEGKVGHRLRAICSRSCRSAIPIVRLDTLVARPWDYT